jgi:hypothetical protein
MVADITKQIAALALASLTDERSSGLVQFATRK